MGYPSDQVQMLWPRHKQISSSHYQPQDGYLLRTYQPGDENDFYHLMALTGWLGWDAEKLHPWLYRILPEGWFMLIEASSNNITGTCMATHDPTWHVPFCGEVGWTAVHPEHQGMGLGTIVVSAVLACFLKAGYQVVHLYTEEWRYAALKTYLKLGFVPYLDPPQSIQQWQTICGILAWPFTPEVWAHSPG